MAPFGVFLCFSVPIKKMFEKIKKYDKRKKKYRFRTIVFENVTMRYRESADGITFTSDKLFDMVLIDSTTTRIITNRDERRCDGRGIGWLGFTSG